MSQSPSKTMFSLGKKTLPREVIKWMQGLDLSYSVKDYRKDMSNGFLLAEIISRYEPGKIPMHAFENSHNAARIDNNWSQLQLFFTKQTVRNVNISPEEYGGLVARNDPKSDLLFQFICRLYTICTKRNLPENAPLVDLPPTQVHNPNHTTAYLLKDDGKEKLEKSEVHQSNVHSRFLEGDDKSQDRVPTRKIVPHIDNSSNMVEVMGVGIKADGRKATSKRKSWQMSKDESNESQDNPDSQRLIFDYLDEIIEQCIGEGEVGLKEMLAGENSKYRPTECFKRGIATLEKEYTCNFLNQLQLSTNELVPVLLRDIHQIWKFFAFFIKMLRSFPTHSQELNLLLSVIKTYALSAHHREPKRIAKIFIQILFAMLIEEAKMARQWRKKESIIDLTYCFIGRDTADKKVGLAKLKELVGSSNPLYVEWLSVLVRDETENANGASKLLQDYIYYGHQYLAASEITMRTSALKIFLSISKSQYFELIQPYFLAQAACFQESRCDSEQVLVLILIYMNLVKELLGSKDYQNLIKGGNSNTLIKVYNPDNEKNTEDLKRRLQTLSSTIRSLFNSTSDQTVREITARLAISYMSEVKALMHIFLEFTSQISDKLRLLEIQNQEYSLKHFSFTCPPTQSLSITDNSNEIIVEIISLRQACPITNYLPLVNYCLQHLNIKKVNMEIWEDIATYIVQPYCELLAEEQHTDSALIGMKNICAVYFGFDMKIDNFSGMLGDALVAMCGRGDRYRANVVQFSHYLNEEYIRSSNESIKTLLEDLHKLLGKNGYDAVK